MKYFDFSIYEKLIQMRSNDGLVSLVERESGIHIDTTPEMSVYGMNTLLSRIDVHNMDSLYRLEMDILGVLADMELTGVMIDTERLRQVGQDIRADIVKTEHAIAEIVPGPVNLNSPKQLQVLLFEKLGIKPTKKNKTGYSVDNEVLEEIAKTHDIARLIVEYRTLSKLESTYIAGLSKSINPKTRTIHTTYDSLGALTGRMSSESPNLQNIPTGDGYAREIKSCFIPRPGRVLVVADYSQIELRVLAFLSQDRSLLEAFFHNEDIHMRTARYLFPDRAEITSHERRIAKTVNFGVIYGITGFGLSKTLGCSPWEATDYIEAFYKLYPGVRAYYDTVLEGARRDGFVSTFFSRKRKIASINDANKTIRSIAEREAINMPVQGTAADILKIAMVAIFREIETRGLSSKMILQVHDELVFDVLEDEKDQMIILIRECMESVLLRHTGEKSEQVIPPIRVDIGYGKNWAEAK